MIRPVALLGLTLLSGCIAFDPATLPFPPRTGGGGGAGAAAGPPPATTGGPVTAPRNAVRVTLTDGSPGLALWCEAQSDCIAEARAACDNRQSIRTVSDIDRSATGASEFFARAEGAAATLVVACG